MRVDFHVHSNISMDCKTTMEDALLAALEKGINILCFTDHCDPCDAMHPGRLRKEAFFDWQESFAEIQRMRERYGDKIEILHGMELGEIAMDKKRTSIWASTPGLDFVLGSVHVLPKRQDFYYLKYRDLDHCKQLMEEYLQENIRVAQANVADVIAHVGYLNRYASRQGFYVELREYEGLLRQLFSVLISHGKGIEINTSGLRGTTKEAFPDFDTLKLYRACGGEIITIGSDAHFAKDVGAGWDEAKALLQQAGFQYFTIFRQRKPEFILL